MLRTQTAALSTVVYPLLLADGSLKLTVARQSLRWSEGCCEAISVGVATCLGLGLNTLAAWVRPRCTMHLHMRTVLCALLRWSVGYIMPLRPNTDVFGRSD